MHITELLIEKGYKPYRFLIKSNWNKEAKKEAQTILNQNKDTVIFKNGDSQSDESSFYVPYSFNYIYLSANYNVMKVGGTDVRFIKDKDFTKEFIFGLNELNNPPTLIYPRPNIRFSYYDPLRNSILTVSEKHDKAMNHCLNVEKAEDIIKAIEENLMFEYDVSQ